MSDCGGGGGGNGVCGVICNFPESRTSGASKIRQRFLGNLPVNYVKGVLRNTIPVLSVSFISDN